MSDGGTDVYRKIPKDEIIKSDLRIIKALHKELGITIQGLEEELQKCEIKEII